MDEYLETIKVEAALRSENMKMKYREAHKPKEINILDFTVIKALEKQIPQKPVHVTAEKDTKIGSFIFRKGTKIYSCTCNKWIGYRDSFCRHCGQKLEWD